MMLLVLVKFGRPLEQDAMQLLHNKLKAHQESKENPLAQSERLQRFIDQLADSEIEKILRTMGGYRSNSTESLSKHMYSYDG